MQLNPLNGGLVNSIERAKIDASDILSYRLRCWFFIRPICIAATHRATMLVPVMLSPSTPSSVANSKCHQQHGIPFFISVDNNNINIPFHHHHHRPTIHKSKKIVSKLHLAQMLSTSSLYRSLGKREPSTYIYDINHELNSVHMICIAIRLT